MRKAPIISASALFFIVSATISFAESGIHQGRDNSGRVICNLKNYPTRGEMDALANIAENDIDISTDRGWKISNITLKVWEHWGWFDSYENARSNYVSATGSVIDYQQVDRAVMTVAAYACKNIW